MTIKKIKIADIINVTTEDEIKDNAIMELIIVPKAKIMVNLPISQIQFSVTDSLDLNSAAIKIDTIINITTEVASAAIIENIIFGIKPKKNKRAAANPNMTLTTILIHLLTAEQQHMINPPLSKIIIIIVI